MTYYAPVVKLADMQDLGSYELKISLNTDFEIMGIVDNYSSCIFTSRYWGYGDFELYIKANSQSLEILQLDYYIKRDGDSQIYVIETIKLETDPENGDFLTVTGRSGESLLTRRILFDHRKIDLTAAYNIGGFAVEYPTDDCKTVEDCIRHAVEMTIAPTDQYSEHTKWAWDGGFVLGERQGYTEAMAQTQILGTYLYDFITEQCQSNGYGFRVHLNDDNKFEFNLYKGCDCSYNQTDNPYVIFSPEFDNLSNTNYLFNKTDYKNYAYVIGKADTKEERFWTERPLNGKYTDDKGLNYLYRRELFVDASSVSKEEKDANNNTVTVSDSKYTALIGTQAREKLMEYLISETFDGDIVSTNMTYSLGDIVQIENEYGIQATARILEIIESEDESGYSIVPTFSTWEV